MHRDNCDIPCDLRSVIKFTDNDDWTQIADLTQVSNCDVMRANARCIREP